MSCMGVSDLIRITQLHAMSCLSTIHVTPYDLDKLFLPLFSPEGSNAREEEEALILNWKDYIYEAEGY